MNDILQFVTANNLLFLAISLVFLWLIVKIIKLFAYILRKIKFLYFILILIGFYIINRYIPQYAMNLVACGIFLWCLLDITSEKLNLSKSQRYQQSIMPFTALLYFLLIVFAYIKLYNWLIIKLSGWYSLISRLYSEYIPMMTQETISTFYTWLLGHLKFLQVMDLEKWGYYTINIFIILFFIGFKRIFMKNLPKLDSMWINSAYHPINLFGFYEYDGTEDSFVLAKKYEHASDLLKKVFWWAIGISIAIMVYTKIRPLSYILNVSIFPVFGLLIIGELLNFLSGNKGEPHHDPIGVEEEDTYIDLSEDSKSQIIYNFRKIYPILKKGINDPNRVLAETVISSSFSTSIFEHLEKLENSECKTEQAIGKFFTKLKEKGEQINTELVQITIDMIKKRESVLINSPFYKDLDNYIVIPIMLELMAYNKVLIIAGRDNTADDVKVWIDNAIEKFSGTKTLWKSSKITKRDPEYDIGILSFTDIYNRQILANKKEFLKQVSIVLLIEPSHMISTGQIGLTIIVDHLDRENVIYCACDRESKDLNDVLRMILKEKKDYINEVNYDTSSQAICYIMNWDAARDKPIQHSIDDLKHVPKELSMDVLLSLIALKNDVPISIWLSSTNFPAIDIKNKNKKILSGYLGVNDTELDKKIDVKKNLWDLGISDAAFITVEDEINNIFETSRLFGTRAQNICFINTVSDNYLLRDYIADNPHIFAKLPDTIPFITSNYRRTERNIIVELLLRMLDEGIKECDLQEKFTEESIEITGFSEEERQIVPACISNKDVYLKLVSLIKKYFLLNEDIEFAIESKYDVIDLPDAETKVVNTTYIKLNGDTELGKYANKFLFTEIILPNKKEHPITLLRNQVSQKYLPKQYFSYDGQYYRIHTVTEKNIITDATSSFSNDIYYYRQIREYCLSNFEIDQSYMARSKGIDITRGVCDEVKVETKGFFEQKSRNNLDIFPNMPVLPDNVRYRTYLKKNVMCLKLKENKDSRSLFTLAVLLNELIVSVFPENYHYISIMIGSNKHETNISMLLHSMNLDGFDENAIYIIEDSEIDLGLLDAISNNLKGLLEIIADYLSWNIEMSVDKDKVKPAEQTGNITIGNMMNNSENKDTIDFESEESDDEVDIEEEMLSKENEEDEFTKTSRIRESDEEDHATKESISEKEINSKREYVNYLNFGLASDDETLKVFDAESTLGFLKKNDYLKTALHNARKSKKDSSLDININYFDDIDSVYCDFCAIKLSEVAKRVLDDGRISCTICHNSAVTNSEQLKRIYLKAFRDMIFFFNVNLDKLSENSERIKIDVFMTNAKKIAKMHNLIFKPTKKYDERPTTYLEEIKEGEYRIWVENGAPKLTTLINIVYELTNIWQKEKRKMNSNSEEKNDDEINMGEWTKIQYLLHLNEVAYAKRMILVLLNNTQEAGMSFAECYKQYGLEDVHNVGISDFFNQFDDDELTEVIGGGGTPFDDQYDDRKKKRFWTRDKWRKRTKKKTDKTGTRICDFDGCIINPEEEYEELPDGRDRCSECSKSVIKEKNDFVTLYQEIRDRLKKHLGVNFDVKIELFVKNANEIAKAWGTEFRPTPGFDARFLGFARQYGDIREIWIENGSPLISMLKTTAHELVHIWQYTNPNKNWNYETLIVMYGNESERSMVLEGLARWSEIQYLLYYVGDTDSKIKGLLKKFNKTKKHSITADKEMIKSRIERALTSWICFDRSEYGRGFANYYYQYGLDDKYNLGINGFIKNLGLTTLNKNKNPFKNNIPLDIPIFWTEEKWNERINKYDK
ncbi:MAG: hypothetical protein FWG98_03365 [Candidatus Cloacimonetes bacterium]|nr:hypothetical protein [Candidatus Cloacimonadota bacterium]